MPLPLQDFRGTSISTMALNTQYDYIAYGSELGQTKIEPFTKQMVQVHMFSDIQYVHVHVYKQTSTFVH